MNKEQIVGLVTLGLLIIVGSIAMVKRQASLAQYKKRRDFAKTTEPKGIEKKRQLKTSVKNKIEKSSKQPIFVIQQHAARAMHYDFRLEVDGVLASWAVPKGPSTNPHDKRLAVLTENHPLEYADFEGAIPEGEYGAGEVIIWDRGTYENLKEPKTMADCFDDGTIEVFLHGEKLQGSYALVRMKTNNKNWLLIKMNDEFADARKNIVVSEPESVISGTTIKDLKKNKK
jgi:DNA ligase D-like protein (predicted 3'-phosphoesterase)